MSLTPEALLTVAHRVAKEAADLVMQGWRSQPSVRKKAPTDLVTEFDLRSEAHIVQRLRELCPGVPVVAEERGGTRPEGLHFICDPIDGTTNFAHGHYCWCVSIAALDGDRRLAGAVVAPAVHTEWTAYRGGAALRNGRPCRVSATDDIRDALVATGFPPNRDTAPDNNFATFERVKKRVRAVRRCGSAAMDLCLVADGTYDAYWERRVHIWDLAAAACLLDEAGGTLTAMSGGQADLERGHVLASNGALHEALLPLLGDA